MQSPPASRSVSVTKASFVTPSQSPPPARSTSPIKTPREKSPATLVIKSLSKGSSPSTNVAKPMTPRSVGVLHRSVSVTSSTKKSPKVARQSSLSEDRSGKITQSIADEILLKSPTSGRSSRSESPAGSQSKLSDKSSSSTVLSSSVPAMRFTATPRPRHNRASILRTSLHHDSELLQEMSEMFSANESLSASTRQSALRSRFSSSALKTETSNLPGGPKRKTEDTDAEARAEKAAKRLKMETPKSLS